MVRQCAHCRAVGGVCAVVELYTAWRLDTLTCPFAAAAVILPLAQVWGV
jgi:hypothetical protein